MSVSRVVARALGVLSAAGLIGLLMVPPAGASTRAADLATTVDPTQELVSALPHGHVAVTFHVTVTNDGPNGAGDVVVTDTWGFSTFNHVVQHSTALYCALAGSSLVCKKGWMRPGTSLTFAVSLVSTQLGLPHQIAAANSASASSTTFDPNTANNAATGDYEFIN
jgi:Domain of unknown function DUF11